MPVAVFPCSSTVVLNLMSPEDGSSGRRRDSARSCESTPPARRPPPHTPGRPRPPPPVGLRPGSAPRSLALPAVLTAASASDVLGGGGLLLRRHRAHQPPVGELEHAQLRQLPAVAGALHAAEGQLGG